MTERLYYADSYATTFDATVTEVAEVEGHPALVLDRTYFYPSSGGQPHDTGTLNGINVVHVLTRDTDAAVLHVLEISPSPVPDSIQVGQQIEGKINWARRFDHMQQHTGQHLLTRAFMQAANANTVSFHLSPDTVTLDLDVAQITDIQLTGVEALANRIVQEDRPVTATIRQPDEQESVRMRKLPKHLLTDGLRIVEIKDFDSTACGGTHVARTGEIGLIKIIKLERRGDKTRVEFRCGNRAIVDYQGKHVAISTLAADMNCRYDELLDNVNKLRAELKAAQTALKDTRGQLSLYEADRLLANADRSRGFAVIASVYAERDSTEIRLLATRLTEQPGTIALFGIPGDKAQLIFTRSADLPHDMGSLLKTAAAKLGGRGGGQPNFAQGGGVKADAAALEQVIAEVVDQITS
ncbi:MAG: DHHA1 domain-containing protein [Anaerolineae bacterium]